MLNKEQGKLIEYFHFVGTFCVITALKKILLLKHLLRDSIIIVNITHGLTAKNVTSPTVKQFYFLVPVFFSFLDLLLKNKI